MSDVNEKCLELFPAWLGSLGADVGTILRVLENDAVDVEARRTLAGGINYLFKSLDLIPDGIDDIGYLDDAFVLRVAARAALEHDVSAAGEERVTALRQLSMGCALIAEFLGQDIQARFERYVGDLKNGAARGRMVSEIVENADVLAILKQDVDAFVHDYEEPSFTREAKTLIRLKSFFEAKLPK